MMRGSVIQLWSSALIYDLVSSGNREADRALVYLKTSRYLPILLKNSSKLTQGGDKQNLAS